MTKPFQDIVDPTGREMFSERFDSSGVDSGTSSGGSTLPTNRYCIAVIDEDSFYYNSAIDARWATFRSTWPDRPFFLLNPTKGQSGGLPIYYPTYWNPFGGPDDYQSFPPGPSGGYVSANGPLWIPGAAYSDPNFDYMPVSRVGFSNGTSDWAVLTGVNLLSAGAKVGLFVDNSGSMYTSAVQDSYDNFIAYCSTHSIDIITVFNSNQNWIDPFTAMAG
jgi:hypothetical protein